jgi:hypothetical protein
MFSGPIESTEHIYLPLPRGADKFVNCRKTRLQRLIDYGIAIGYLRGRTVQRTSG